MAATLSVAFCVSAIATPLHAQSDEPFSTARFRFGPLALTPSAAVTDIGVDSNVFNEAVNPKRDFTATVAPILDAWFRAGRSRLSAQGQFGVQYFHTYSDQRSFQGGVKGRYDIFWARVQPFVTFESTAIRQRTGFEIDGRVRNYRKAFGFGTDIRVTPKVTASISAERLDKAYADEAEFYGVRLVEILNRREDALHARVAHRLTVLTTAVVEASAMQRRFTFSPGRNADSVRVVAGFELEPLALISGGVRLGGLKFDGVGGGAPGFTGFVMDVDVGYTLLGRTRIDLTLQRDLEYSFEPVSPYYIQTGGTLTVTPRLTTHWDVRGRVGSRLLAYREPVDSGSAVREISRRDRYVLLGLGVGYNVGRGVRLGVGVDREERRTESGRSFEGYRIGSSVTYAN